MRFLISIIFALVAVSLSASDEIREQNAAIEIKRTLKVGQAIQLQAGNQRFLALYAETISAENKGTAILLHDRGRHPEQLNLIHILRTQLPEHQWATLSLQMPVREAGAVRDDYFALFPEAAERVQAAVDYIASNDNHHIIIIGYGLGALMAVYYLSEHQENAVQALVAVSLPVPKTDEKMAQTLRFLEQIQTPLMDIFAEHDPSEIKNSARKKQMASKQNLFYRQLRIVNAGHDYQNNGDLLVKRIYSWLNRVTKDLPQ